MEPTPCLSDAAGKVVDRVLEQARSELSTELFSGLQLLRDKGDFLNADALVEVIEQVEKGILANANP